MIESIILRIPAANLLSSIWYDEGVRGTGVGLDHGPGEYRIDSIEIDGDDVLISLSTLPEDPR